MKDYSAMSDFEINKEVAYLNIGGDWLLEPSDERKFTFYNLEVQTRNTVELPDYCNNPADAWPIIVESGIGVMPFKSDHARAWDLSRGLVGDRICHHANPLRAAMIVYLQMNDK